MGLGTRVGEVAIVITAASATLGRFLNSRPGLSRRFYRGKLHDDGRCLLLGMMNDVASRCCRRRCLMFLITVATWSHDGLAVGRGRSAIQQIAKPPCSQ